MNVLRTVARMPGVRAVVPCAPAITHAGAATSQAVVQHRIDQISEFQGEGITIGILSDSYDGQAVVNVAADDIASGDLPGPGNPLGNTEPVVILEDLPGFSDEGRAMAQLIHDVAPKARLGFATAFLGEVSFASNIKALAGVPGEPNTRPDFKADIIVDDIGYFSEPFFQDGIIAQAVDDVADRGVSYFSAGGNTPSTQAYDSPARIVPADPSSWANTNLDFSNVDPALYAGGFHNFDENGLDIAETLDLVQFEAFSFQWNEPFDPQPPEIVGLISSGTGNVPNSDTFTFSGEEGTDVEIFVDGDDTNGDPNPDVTITLIDPNGNETFVDFDTSPDSLFATLPVTGTYTVVIGGFEGATGDFLYEVREVDVSNGLVRSDYNLLFF
ncbi:MAG: S8 family serine peptidase, partial [Myxococcota bacterium]